MVKEKLRKFEKVCDIVDQYHRDGTKLIPILQAIQEEYRYLPEEILALIASTLNLSPAKVFGVSTFYSHFTLKPRGKYVIRVCDGTACHVKKSTALLDALRQLLQLTAEKATTPDMMFTVDVVSCLGACGLAPAMVVNDEVCGQMTPAKAVERIKTLSNGETAHVH